MAQPAEEVERRISFEPETSDEAKKKDNSTGVEITVKKNKKVHVTPLPKLKMLAVAATLLTESICGTMLLPFVGLYVAHLQHISVEEAGYSSGILVGLFMLGQVVSAKMWGWLSDVYGRRIPLIVGLFAGAWTMLFFGMAPNIYVCCLMRFIHGFFNGNVLIAKIIIADITDSTNAALGFSMIGLLWSVGAAIGPAVGGFLYDPYSNPMLQWMHVKQGSYLARHPAFLPSAFVFVYALSNFLLVLVLVPETNPHRTGSLRNVPVIGWVVNWIHPKEVSIVSVDDATPGITTPPPAREAPAATMTYAQALKDPVLRTITILLMCLASADMTFTEILPLWAIAPREVGGLAMFSDDLGTIMLCFAIPTFLTNLCFPRIYRKVQNFSIMWRWGVSILALSVFLVPFGALLRPSGAFWFVLALGSVKNSSCSGSFTIVQLLTGRAAPPGKVGAVYGISQSFGALVRCVVPFVVAPLFAWSISGHHLFPFNHYMVFFLCVVPLAFSFYLTLRHPIERTAEELLASRADNAENEGYRPLANAYCASQAHNVFQELPAMELENARQGMIADWMRQTAPRGGTAQLEWAVKALQQEDWRIVTDEDEQEDSSTVGEGREDGDLDDEIC